MLTVPIRYARSGQNGLDLLERRLVDPHTTVIIPLDDRVITLTFHLVQKIGQVMIQPSLTDQSPGAYD